MVSDETSWGLVLTGPIGDIALSLSKRKTISRVIDEAIERDRASRSPGDELAAARRVIYVLGGEVGVARGLLTASDLGRYCGYDHDAETCPMPLPCWHHRRNAACAGKR